MKVVFYLDYDKFKRREAPAILPFIQLLRDRGSDVIFASSENRLMEEVARGCDVAAISVFSSLELRDALQAAVRVKKHDPRVVTIFGGQGVTGIAGKLIHALGVDVIVEGEGENVLPLLLHFLDTNALVKDNLLESFSEDELILDEAERTYFGDRLRLLLEDRVLYKSPIPQAVGAKMVKASFTRQVFGENGGMAFLVPVSGVMIRTYEGEILRAVPNYQEAYSLGNERMGDKEYPSSFEEYRRYSMSFPTEEELNDSARYPWDIFDNGGWETISIYAQRGCNWGRCSYCGISTPFGRRLAPSRVVEWLKEAKNHGVTMATFEDDQFLQSKKWIEELCSLIIKEGLSSHFQFGAMIRVDAIRGIDSLKKLRDAGFIRLQIGVESLIPEKVRYFRKTIPGKEEEYVKKAHDLVENCLFLGIQPGIFIITTRPREESALLEVAKELKAVSQILRSSYERFSRLPTFSFNDLLMAYPGAPLLGKEEYKKVIIPLGPTKTPKGIMLSTIPLPYIFELKSIALANFIGNLREISRRRGISPEIVNETLEHLKDLLDALELSAEQMVTEIGVALKVIESMDLGGGEKRRKMKMLIAGRCSPAEILEGQNISQIRALAEEERERILALCGEVRANLIAVEDPITREVNNHLMRVRKRLKTLEALEGTQEDLHENLDTLRMDTEELLQRTYPLYKSRKTLEALIEFMDEFEKYCG
jgi:radical SAM superfamily enzyme YgiQ (UPF0313 family)